MFATFGDNLKYCLRSVAAGLKGVEIDTLTVSGVSIDKIEELLLYGIDEGWRDLPVPDIGLGELCRLAHAAGGGLTLGVGTGEELDGWVQGVETQWSPAETSQALVPAAKRCSVCRHPRRIEIDVSLAKGVAVASLARLFNMSVQSLSRHRSLCLAGRLERLAHGLGNAADLSSLVGTVTVMDKVMNFAERAGEQALVQQEHAAVDSILSRMLQGVEIRAKLTGELRDGQSEDAGPTPASVGPGPQVSVLVVPTREQLEAQMRPMVVDVKGDRV